MPWKIVAGDKGCHADAPKANGGTAVRCEDGLWTEQAIAGIPGAAHVSALIQEAVDVSEIRRHRIGLRRASLDKTASILALRPPAGCVLTARTGTECRPPQRSVWSRGAW